MNNRRSFLRRATGAAAACCLAGLANASDPPDSRVNPVTGAIETTDSTWSGSQYNVRHALQPADGSPASVFIVSSDPADDNAPRIAIGSGGDSWVVWWRDQAIDGVYLRKRSLATGAWSGEARQSATDVQARNPEIVAESAGVRMVWEEGSVGGVRSIAVTAVSDDPQPIPEIVHVGSTTFEGDLDSRLHREAGTTWLTWVDSPTHVGWAKWTGSAWTPAAYESYAADSVEQARGRVRSEVLAND